MFDASCVVVVVEVVVLLNVDVMLLLCAKYNACAIIDKVMSAMQSR